jgi:hypothetical protein
MRSESTWASTTLGDDQTANVYYYYADYVLVTNKKNLSIWGYLIV